MSERLRILAAAAEMRSFSAAALGARADANINTVRTVLQRDKELFEVIGEEERGVGRPARRFRIADAARLTAELARAQLAGTDPATLLSPAPEPLTGTEPRQRPDAALLETAYDSFARALEADDVHERAIYARAAASTASALLLPDDELPVPRYMALIDSGHSRRAAVLALASEMVLLTCGEATGIEPGEGFRRVASALTAVIKHAPDEAPNILRGVMAVSRKFNIAPPVAFVSNAHAPHLLADGSGDWVAHSLDEVGTTLWSPSWAEELVERRTLAGMVVDGHDVADFTGYLARLEDWHMPKIVACAKREARVANEIGRAGAINIDDLQSLDEAIDPLGKALEQRGTSITGDAVIAASAVGLAASGVGLAESGVHLAASAVGLTARAAGVAPSAVGVAAAAGVVNGDWVGFATRGRARH